SSLTPPDLLIYLRKSLPKLRKNIQTRGRGYEEKISDGYLSNLNRYYDEWIGSYSDGKVLVIDSDDLDFVKYNEDFEGICRRIESQFDQQELFLFS
ncbi:MAG TPA: deoxynucleoside kinase, partial [Oligoflexia bacterium]|nr:deoxynucleoside kinase [Oligoflexia bacterium]